MSGADVFAIAAGVSLVVALCVVNYRRLKATVIHRFCRADWPKTLTVSSTPVAGR